MSARSTGAGGHLTFRPLGEAGPTPGEGFVDGLVAGRAWAESTPPAALDGGYPACENVQESGFPSDAYARGYARGVWGTWCQRHPAESCFGTWICRVAVREAARSQSA